MYAQVFFLCDQKVPRWKIFLTQENFWIRFIIIMRDKNVTSEKSFIRKTSNRIKETLLGQKREKKNILQPLFIPEEVVKLG